MDLYEELRLLLAEFERQRVEYALCGGLALAVHGLPRFTNDLDVLVPESSLSAAVAAAVAVGYDRYVDALRLPVEGSEPTEIRRLNKFVGADFLTLDLLLVGSAVADVWSTRQRFDSGGQTVWCISRAGLIKLKRRAGRERDLADLKELEALRDDDSNNL